jgi:hypothetical protein
MTIDDCGIKSGLRQTFEEGCSLCPKESFCANADGWNKLAKDTLEYIVVLESSLKEYMDAEEIRRNREHASNWVNYWREKHGEMTLTWPDWDEIFKDWEEAHALAQSRLRRVRLFKTRAQRYLVDANHYKWLYKDAVEALENQPKWISVEERLPEVSDLVLVIANGKPKKNVELINACLIASFWGDEGWIADGFDGWDKLKVTHWMPLPPAPENTITPKEAD